MTPKLPVNTPTRTLSTVCKPGQGCCACDVVQVEWQNLQQALPNLQSLGDLRLDVFPATFGHGPAPHWLDMAALTSITKLYLALHCWFNGYNLWLPN